MADAGVTGAGGVAANDGRGVSIRVATRDDIPALEALIARSAAALGRTFYAPDALAMAIRDIFGVDSQLVDDGSYLVAEIDGGRLAGCGGWSRFATLFGSDRYADRSPALLVPGRDAARVRAMFTAPDYVRRGVGSAIMQASEQAARAAGFDALALMATLSGVAFYQGHGFIAAAGVTVDAGGIAVPFVPMHKTLHDPAGA
jgi:GNAT superfamily N-acetyltransferase